MNYFSFNTDSAEHGLRTTLNIIFKVLNVFSQLHFTLNALCNSNIYTGSVLNKPAAGAKCTHSVAMLYTSALPD